MNVFGNKIPKQHFYFSNLCFMKHLKRFCIIFASIMCGITGILNFDGLTEADFSATREATTILSHRGPHYQAIKTTEFVALGHARLAVIDVSEDANQPMTTSDGRYTIVYNGEFYNFKEERTNLEKTGYSFRTHSDTEVILALYAQYGADCLQHINGCFAFAVYDKKKQQLFLARDRFGIKPLYVFFHHNKLVFASELKAFEAYHLPQQLDIESALLYFRFTYIPGPHTIYKHYLKLTPGTFLEVSEQKTNKQRYYHIPKNNTENKYPPYEDALMTVRSLVSQAVQRRLVADVPLGAFLSGGIDSSVVVAEASKQVSHLQTFSIGYADNAFFDETHYAELVAKHFHTKHTSFKLTEAELFSHFTDFIQQIDEPFADSSALAVFILSRYTADRVTVALSGDGADELFSGYNKHSAHLQAITPSYKNTIAKTLHFLFKYLPQSRDSYFGNKIRQANKLGNGLNLDSKNRYWEWAKWNDEKYLKAILKNSWNDRILSVRKDDILEDIEDDDFNAVLFTDFKLVLANDMLYKVDKFSMAHALEVRTPFLDHELVNFVFPLPTHYKITPHIRKRLLQDAYRKQLPAQLYNRPKHGFEVPLTRWLQHDLKPYLNTLLLDKDFINQQGLFKFEELQNLVQIAQNGKLPNSDILLWTLLIFQIWYKNKKTRR